MSGAAFSYAVASTESMAYKWMCEWVLKNVANSLLSVICTFALQYIKYYTSARPSISFRFQFVWPQFSTLAQTFLNELWHRKHGRAFGLCSQIHARALTWICGWHSSLCVTVISGSDPEPVQWFPWENPACFWFSATWGPRDHFQRCPLWAMILWI